MYIKLLQLGGFLVSGIIVSIIINGLLLRFSKSLGIRNEKDVIIRWSNQSKPSIGGISFFIVFIFTAIGFSIVFNNDGSIFKIIEFVGLLTAGSLAFLMGLADDAYNTRPFIKLFIQIFCGLILIFTNTIVDLTNYYWIDCILTILWVVTLMNSLNMLDNMDGITGTTATFVLICCLISSFIIFDFNRNIWSIIIVSQIGAILGFLKYNLNPSKLFMGDSGSQFIGLLVSFFTIKYLWNVGELTKNPLWVGFFVCLISLTPAAADSLTVTINRLRKGKSPMVGGKDHTTHHLVYAGLNDKQVWFIYSLISIASTLLSVFMVYLCTKQILLPILFFFIFFLSVFLILYRFTVKYHPPKEK
jgi:UDP-GlcNAc:undecaprenyl-phosphate GlcNAc-1-phosphate transferase